MIGTEPAVHAFVFFVMVLRQGQSEAVKMFERLYLPLGQALQAKVVSPVMAPSM